MLRQLFLRLSMICLLCLWFNHAIFAQPSFENLDLRQARCASTTESANDAFAQQACNIIPWFVTHGSPDIHEVNGKRHINIGSGVLTEDMVPKDREDLIGSVSEGVGYAAKFTSGRRYKINITFWGRVDKFNVFLANRLPNPTETEDIRNRKIPDVSDKQQVFVSSEVTSSPQTVDILFIPERDFNNLWFFSECETVAERVANGATLSIGEFQVNSLSCDNNNSNNTLSKTITSTSIITNYGFGDIRSVHVGLPPKTTAPVSINIISNRFVTIAPLIRTVPFSSDFRDSKISLVAGRSILITPNRSADVSVFEAIKGSVFSATIAPEEKNLCEPACEQFMPWDSPIKGFNVNTFVSPCSLESEFLTWRIRDIYPIPYNAYKADLKIFNKWGGLVFHQVFEDPNKRGLERGIIKWRPRMEDIDEREGSAKTVKLVLTNCFGESVKYGSVRVICSPIANNDGLSNDFTAESIISRENDLEAKSLPLPTVNGMNNQVNVFPNPTNGIVKFITNLDIEGATINVANILGGNEKQFKNDILAKNEQYEYDISDLPNGIYIISVLSKDKVVSYHKINKL